MFPHLKHILDVLWVVYGVHAILSQAWLIAVDRFVASVSMKKIEKSVGSFRV